MSSCIFRKNIVYPSINLPLTLSSLEEWSLIYVEGADSKKHLQNQFTIDINFLKKEEYKLCAHCNFNGKVWATMFLFHYRRGYAYIVRKSVAEIQIKELQKYAIFSDVKIQELDNFCLFGLSGFGAKFFYHNFLLICLMKTVLYFLMKKELYFGLKNPLKDFC